MGEITITLPGGAWLKSRSFALPKAPSWRDARWLQALILTGYSFVAREYFYLESSLSTAFGCLLYACALDYVLGVLIFRKPVFPLSAVIIALSSTILVDTSGPSGYYFVVTVALLSKALLRYDGRHYFNPTCFSVTVALMLFPDDIVAIPHLFSGYVWPSVIFAILGLCTVTYARQAVVSLSWYMGFIFFAMVRAWLMHAKMLFIMAPALGSSVLLFTFHMISDPATVPRGRRWQLIFGVCVAAIDAVLRYKQIPFGQFYALAILGALLPWIREWDKSPVSAKS